MCVCVGVFILFIFLSVVAAVVVCWTFGKVGY